MTPTQPVQQPKRRWAKRGHHASKVYEGLCEIRDRVLTRDIGEFELDAEHLEKLWRIKYKVLQWAPEKQKALTDRDPTFLALLRAPEELLIPNVLCARQRHKNPL